MAGGYEAHNMTGFIGNYCHGNQPSHSIPYTYYFIGKQEKAQCVLDSIMGRFYDMGAEKLAYAGMDDAGEMSAWYVLNAIGLYTYSPADPEYIVSVPLFDKVTFTLGDNTTFTILKEGNGKKIRQIRYDGDVINGWFVTHDQLKKRPGIGDHNRRIGFSQLIRLQSYRLPPRRLSCCFSTWCSGCSSAGSFSITRSAISRAL